MKNALLSCFFFLFALSLGAQSATENLRIFPNPVAESFEIGESDRVTNIRVLNMVGREVKKFDFTAGTKYAITDLPPGMYLVQLRDGEDQVVHTQRVKKS